MPYKDPEKDREYARAYRAAHREEVAEYDRVYRAAHREEIAERERQYRAEHREEIAERQAAWWSNLSWREKAQVFLRKELRDRQRRIEAMKAQLEQLYAADRKTR